jgi:5-methylcytosine-specific restriction endonuclease McrA
MARRRRTAGKRLTPAEWHQQRAQKRIKRFASLSDDALERRLAEYRATQKLLQTEIQIAKSKHAAIQPRLRLMKEYLELLMTERWLISQRNQKTGWAGYFSPGITPAGEKELSFCDQLIKACNEQLDATGHCSIPAFDRRGSKEGEVPTKFLKLAIASEELLKPVDGEIAIHLEELAHRQHSVTVDRRARNRQAAAEAITQANTLFSQRRRAASAAKPKLRRDHDCPYCSKPLGLSPHADHIHPISMGGLSSVDNMVYVCSSCNARKQDMTLQEFIRLHQLDRVSIEQRLLLLGKRF